MPSPAERFIDLLSELLPEISDEQRVRLEDAFVDAVEERIDRRERQKAEGLTW